MNKKIRNLGMLNAPSAIVSDKLSPSTVLDERKLGYSDISDAENMDNDSKENTKQSSKNVLTSINGTNGEFGASPVSIIIKN